MDEYRKRIDNKFLCRLFCFKRCFCFYGIFRCIRKCRKGKDDVGDDQSNFHKTVNYFDELYEMCRYHMSLRNLANMKIRKKKLYRVNCKDEIE